MYRTLHLAAAVIAVLGLVACRVVPEPRGVDLVITEITVIDPSEERVLPGRTVYIDGGRITAVHDAADSGRFRPACRIDGPGKFLIPGLVDMHVHTAHPHFSEQTLKLMLANGVTGVREMSGDCWEPRGAIFACIDDYRELQRRIQAGEVAGVGGVSRRTRGGFHQDLRRHPP